MIPFNFNNFVNSFQISWNNFNEDERKQWTESILSLTLSDRVEDKTSYTDRLYNNICLKESTIGKTKCGNDTPIEINRIMWSANPATHMLATSGDSNGCYATTGIWESYNTVGPVYFINYTDTQLSLTIKRKILSSSECDTTTLRLVPCIPQNTDQNELCDLCYSWKPMSQQALDNPELIEYVPGCEDMCVPSLVYTPTFLLGDLSNNIPPAIINGLRSILLQNISVPFTQKVGSTLFGEYTNTQNVDPIWVPPYAPPGSDNGDVWTTSISASVNLDTKVLTSNFVVSHNTVINGSTTLFAAAITKNNIDESSNELLEISPTINGWLYNWPGNSGMDFEALKLNVVIPSWDGLSNL